MKFIYANDEWEVYRHKRLYLVFAVGAQVNTKTFASRDEAMAWIKEQP